MRYQSIVLELIQDQPELHETLRASRTLLSTVERQAEALKARHEEWIGLLGAKRPRSDPSQLASEALEIALHEVEEDLRFASKTDEEGPSLDGAMAYLRRHTPTA